MSAVETGLVADVVGDEGVVVRGTDDPRRARTAALRALLDYHLVRGAVAADALFYARRLRDARPCSERRFRWGPCNESSCFDGGGHRVHLLYPTTPGRGSWVGVYWPEV